MLLLKQCDTNFNALKEVMEKKVSEQICVQTEPVSLCRSKAQLWFP